MLRIEELKALIKKYDKQYYEEGVSEISDAEYDRLYAEYVELEKNYPEFQQMKDSPTRKIGAGDDAGTTTGLPKFTHKSPLLSIDKKAKEISDLEKFYKDCNGASFIVEPKLDGITCNINYENGLLVNAATRGNGYVGDLITDNFKATDTKYPSLITCSELEVRGEAIIPYDFFKKHLANNYSNPRNAVSGILRQIESSEVKGKGIQVMFYDIGQTDYHISDSDSQNVQTLNDMGFMTVPNFKATSWEELKKIVETKLNGLIKNIDGFNVLCHPDFPQAVCDGLVIKVDSLKQRNEIGFSLKGPKFAFAYKFKPLRAKTRIDHVEWQVGKSGRVSPVAVFDEVSLGGTKITRATLNNFDYMQNLPVVDSNTEEPLLDNVLNLSIDDTILLERSNDVIPRVVGIVNRGNYLYTQDVKTTELYGKRLETFNEPTVCPVCGATLKREGPLHFCDNPTCSAQICGKIEHFASRDAMNIVGFGESIVNLLFEQKIINNLFDIYTLNAKKDILTSLEGFGEKKVNNLLREIENSKTPELWRFIYGLSIPYVGKQTAKDLAQRYHTIDTFLSASYEDLLNLENFAETTAIGIYNYINTNSFKELVSNLLVHVRPKAIEIFTEKFKGLTFVITGTLQNPRNYYQEIIEKNGGKVSNSVSKKTYAVLIGNDAGSKETKARELVNKGANILILDNEEEIINFLKG